MPVFVCEAASPEKRGSLVTCVNLAITIGQFIAACVSGLFITTQGGWRYMVGLAALPAMIQFIGFLFLPESPRWLLEHGHIDQAISALRLLRGCDNVRDEVEQILEVIRIEKSIHNKQIMSKLLYGASNSTSTTPSNIYIINSNDDNGSNTNNVPGIRNYSARTALLPPKPTDEIRGGSLHSISSNNPNRNPNRGRGRDRESNTDSNRDTNETDGTDTTDENDISISTKSFWEEFSTSWMLLTSSVTTRRALVVGCALQASQQIGGINTVMYYTATILKLAGFSSDFEAVWLSAVVAFCNVLGTIIGLYCVDRIGRRKLTLTSLGLVCFVLMAIGVVFYLAEHESQHINANTTDNIDNCNQYQYCFDCVQDDNCGYCSSYNTDTDTDRNTDIDIDTTTGYTACVAGDDSMATQDQQCHSQYYYGTTCPGDATVTIGWIIFILLCSYLFVFAPGMGPMPWCINSEIYPTSVRGLANSIATTVNWGTNFVMSATFLTLIIVPSMYYIIHLGRIKLKNI